MMTFDEAKKMLEGELDADGGLDNHKWCYMHWKPGDARIALDGDFKLIELWAIVTYIQGIRDQRKEG